MSVPNGYSEEDCENLSISAQTDNSIQIFIENTHSDHPTDADEPTELIYEEHTFHLESDTLVQKVRPTTHSGALTHNSRPTLFLGLYIFIFV